MEEDYEQVVTHRHQITLPSGETVVVESGHVRLPGANQTVPLGTYDGALRETYEWETSEHYNQKLKKLKKGRHSSSYDRIREDKKGERKRLPELIYRRGEGSIRDPTGDSRAKHASLLKWAQRVTSGYPEVNVRNLSTSWRDGLAFNSVLHRYRPNSVNWRKISSPSRTNKERLRVAFDLAEKEFGVPPTLEPGELDAEDHNEDAKGKIVSYISSLRDALPEESHEYKKYAAHMKEYNAEAREWLIWTKRSTEELRDVPYSLNVYEIKKMLSDIEMFRAVDLAKSLQTKQRLADIYAEFENLYGGTGQLLVENDLSTPFLDKAWSDLLQALEEREEHLKNQLGMHDSLDELARRVQYNIGVSKDKLSLVQHHVTQLESRYAKISSQEITDSLEHIFRQIRSLDKPIEQLFEDVQKLVSGRHPRADDFNKQANDLRKRQREMMVTLEESQKTLLMKRLDEEAYKGIRHDIFLSCEECIEWIRMKLTELSQMDFSEDLKILEQLLDRQKKENRNIEAFRAQVDVCIARNAEISSKDAQIYADLLGALEADYQQLRDLSAGRVLDLDSLIAFVGASQREVKWVEKEAEAEVRRDWSDISSLDIPLLQNHYKRLLTSIEHQEDAYFSVYDEGVKAANRGHPAVRVIEKCLNDMQNQWDWLLSLANCFEIHLQDANNLKKFLEEAQTCEQWIHEQRYYLETRMSGRELTMDQTRQAFKDLQDMQNVMSHYETTISQLTEKCRTSSPLWQRGEVLKKPISVQTLSDYIDKTFENRQAPVPSVILRIPPPDRRLFEFMKKLESQLEGLRGFLLEKQRGLKVNLVRNAMMEVKKWNLNTFLGLDPGDRERRIKELNADVNFVIGEFHPDDSLAKQLKDELKDINEHFYQLFQLSSQGPGSDLSQEFDEKLKALLVFLENAHSKLQHRIRQPIPHDSKTMVHVLHDHKEFEDVLQSCDTEVATVKELFHQLSNPTPQQKSGMDRLLAEWSDVWDLSKLHVQALKSVEQVLNGLLETVEITEKHQRYLTSSESMPSKIDRLRAIHSQLLEMNLAVKQQQPLVDDLERNCQILMKSAGRVGQHDVQLLDSRVKTALDAWIQACSQIQERLVAVESGIQQLMVYKPDYDSEITWLDRVEAMADRVRGSRAAPTGESKHQEDLLNGELLGLMAHGISIDTVTKRGHTFIREAQNYDRRMEEYKHHLAGRGGLYSADRRREEGSPSPSSLGAYQVHMELDELHRKFQLIQSYGQPKVLHSIY